MKWFLLFYSVSCFAWAGAIYWQRSYLEQPKLKISELDIPGLMMEAANILIGLTAQMEVMTGIRLMWIVFFKEESDRVLLMTAYLKSHLWKKTIVRVLVLVLPLV